MELRKNKIDLAYLEFFRSYIKIVYNDVLKGCEAKFKTDFFNLNLTNPAILDSFKDFNYYTLVTDTGEHFFLPPDTLCMSKSGRFVSQDIFYITGYQIYVLWDLKRSVIMPAGFNDIRQLDEKNGIIYGQLTPGFYNKMNGAFDVLWRINFELIEDISYWENSIDLKLLEKYPDNLDFKQVPVLDNFELGNKLAEYFFFKKDSDNNCKMKNHFFPLNKALESSVEQSDQEDDLSDLPF